MPGGQLPEGLVTTNNESVGQGIGNVDRVDLDDVARLWRDYSTSRALLHDNTGERLANYFWRIWSNPAISNSISGSTVARLFMTISEGGNRVRTTPVPSPRSPSPVSRNTTPTPSSPQMVPETTPVTDEAPLPVPASSSLQAIAESASDGKSLSVSSAEESWTESSTATSKDLGSPVESISVSGAAHASSPGAPPPTSPAAPLDRSLSNANKKRASFVTASGARSKTRPSLPRRKSSLGPSSAVVEPKKSPKMPIRKSPPRSPSLRLIQAGPGNVEAATMRPSPGLPSVPSTTTTTTTTTTTSFALPSTSWQDVASPATSVKDPPGTATTPQQPSSWLVDTNFRSRFVENQQRGGSTTNLSDLGKSKSTVRFADQLPGRRATSGASDALVTAVAPKPAPEAATPGLRPRPRRSSDAIVDDDDDDDDGIVPLPRTKSQLSMMIDHERRKSGTHELWPSPLQQVQNGPNDQAASKPKDDDDEGEDDLLIIGRKDGVTRAGAISSKLRGPPKTTPKGSDTFRYQSPPTPPLY